MPISTTRRGGGGTPAEPGGSRIVRIGVLALMALGLNTRDDWAYGTETPRRGKPMEAGVPSRWTQDHNSRFLIGGNEPQDFGRRRLKPHPAVRLTRFSLYTTPTAPDPWTDTCSPEVALAASLLATPDGADAVTPHRKAPTNSACD